MRRPGTIIVVLLLSLAWTAAAGAPEEPPASSDATPKTSEHVEVTAEIGGGTSGPLGATTTVVEPRKQQGLPSTVTALVTTVPGVSENGQGGLLQSFSIRGVARQRVLSLVSGMRIVSERRAGGTFTFVDPLLLDEVEVLQGASSTFYGSGALGGVVQAFPRSFGGWSIRTGYDSNADQNYQVVGAGGDGWSVGLSRRDAGDGEAADGTLLNAHFTQYSAVMRFDWGEGPRRYEVLFIPTYSEDIGKSSTDFPQRTTTYPLERHQMLKFAVDSDGGWQAHAYVHAHDLDTVVDDADQESQVDNDSLDYGLRWESESELGESNALRWGAEVVGRAGVDADEVRKDLMSGSEERFSSLDGADELEAGTFASLRRQWSRARLEVGGRLSLLEQDNDGEDVDESAVDGYVGAVFPVGQRLEFGASVASGVRFPSLSERFFVGTTGRGSVIGNPELDAEHSLSAEASVQWLGKRLLIRGVLFRNDVDDYIERVEIAEDLLTFVNLTEGTIEGIELHGIARPADRWTVNFGGHSMEGRDDDDRPLSDVPPDEVFAGLEHARDGWTVGMRWVHREDKNDPGSGEKYIPSAEILSAGVTLECSPEWSVFLGGANLLDREYFRSADDKAPLAAGRSWNVRLSWRGN